MNPGNEWIDQARRVLDALHAGTATGATSSAAGTEENHGADCRWCPICQVAAVVRGERPELTAALADVLTATATALRAFAGEPEPADRTPAGAAQVDADEEEPGAPPVAQRIDIA